MPVDLRTTQYRFGIDELAENTHNWHAAQNANPAQGVINGATTFLLRFGVQEAGATAAANTDFQFQVAKNGGAFQNITTSSTIVKAVAATALTDAGNCTQRLTGLTGTFESSGAGQTEDGLSGGANNDIAASGNSETECGLQVVLADVVNGDVLTFRLTSPDFTITNNVVPTLTVAESVSVTPTVGGLTLTGVAPSLKLDGFLTPAVGALAAAGQPLIRGPAIYTLSGRLTLSLYDPMPGTGSVGLTGLQPTVQNSGAGGTSLTPAVGALTASGVQAATFATYSATPSAAALTLTGTLATAIAATFLTPSVGSLTLAGVASRMDLTIRPAVGAAALAGAAPRMDLAITPSVGSLTATGTQSALRTPVQITTAAGALGLTGFNPNLGGAIGITATTGALTAAGAAPTRRIDAFVTPSVGALTATAAPPTVTATALVTLTPSTGTLTATATAPVVDFPATSVTATPGAAALGLAGQTPTVTSGGPVVGGSPLGRTPGMAPVRFQPTPISRPMVPVASGASRPRPQMPTRVPAMTGRR